jgi:hypothetical protein
MVIQKLENWFRMPWSSWCGNCRLFPYAHNYNPRIYKTKYRGKQNWKYLLYLRKCSINKNKFVSHVYIVDDTPLRILRLLTLHEEYVLLYEDWTSGSVGDSDLITHVSQYLFFHEVYTQCFYSFFAIHSFGMCSPLWSCFSVSMVTPAI